LIETMAARAEPTAADYERWRAADVAARPLRLAAFRAKLADEGVDAYFGLRRENSRYLTGLELGEGEEKVAGYSGHFLVSSSEVVVMADSRYTVQVRDQCPDARLERVYNDLFSRWLELLASIGSPKRLAVEAGFVSHAMWQKLVAASPDVELVPAEGWIEGLRQVKEPTELERVAASCAVADHALERLLPAIRPGVTEHELALQLEWEMRTHGAEALAFDVAVLSGPNAALPHGSPGPRQVKAGEVLLFDFGAQVCGYRSDMTRTLFVGRPGKRDLEIYEIVARAQQEAIDALAHAIAEGTRPNGKQIHVVARDVIDAAGYGDNFGHGLGHGIGLATHELPSLGMSAAETPLPSPTVFSVEPGIYLDDVTGVRIEDLVVFDAEARRLDRITLFPREVTVVGE
jgi:Xaa-Pro aminopeptidase